MSALTTLSECPTAVWAGDTVIWEITDSDRTAPTWNYVFSFRGKGLSQIDVTSTDNAQSHLCSVAAAETATWLPGSYSAVGVAVGAAGERLTMWRGAMDVRTNLGDQQGDYDSRSWAKRCLDKLEAVIEGRAGRDILNSTIAGQSIGRLTPEQLFALRDRFLADYKAEQNALLAEQGKTAGGHIGFIFNSP